MKTILLRSILISSIAFMQLSTANSLEHWFEQGNEWYEKKDFDSALVYYEKVLGSGIKNSAVYYNLGNTYFRLNRLGQAILNYEKALVLSPGDQDIATNLKFTQLNITDRIPEPKLSVFEKFLWYWHSMFSLYTQLWILFVFLTVSALAFSFALFVSYNTRLWLIYTLSLFVIISALFGSSIGYKIYSLETKKFAIVLEKNIEAKNAPNGDKTLFTVHEGTKFQIRKTVDNWSLVNLPNGVSGWVENSSLGLI